MSQLATSRCPTILLDDEPAELDAFGADAEVGPHKRVADAIVELLTSDDEVGRRVVGIQGKWGAGKSTVVKMVRRSMEANPSIAVVGFDAWAHEGDPLRRTFLDNLIAQLLRKPGWLGGDTWKRKRELLARRLLESTTTDRPTPTSFARWLAASLFPAYWGSLLVQAALSRGHTVIPSFNAPFSPLMVLGLLLASTPIWVLLYFRKRKMGPDGRPVSGLALLMGAGPIKLDREVTQTPEPTSIEFEETFDQLMREALSGFPDRRIVVVVDNLDRISAEEAAALWSTLQTFLQDRSQADWTRQLWTVVPFDSRGMKRILSGRDERSFLDKSFQVVFVVPPPVLSDWRDFLDGLLKRALPAHGEEDRRRVYEVYAAHRIENAAAPTPRELKLFVNQIGAMHRQWQDRYPLARLAYFALLNRDETDIAAGLLNGEVPKSRLEQLLGEDVKDTLVALCFNVEEKLGKQLLLQGPISAALAAQGTEGLKDLERVHGAGFWAVLENYAVHGLPANPDDLANAILSLERSGLSSADRPELRRVVHEIRQHVFRLSQWPLTTDLYSDGACSLTRVIRDPGFSKKMLGLVASGLLLDEATKASAPVHEAMVVRGAKLMGEMRALGHPSEDLSPLQVPATPAEWVESCSALRVLDATVWSTVAPTPQLNVIEFLMQEAANGRLGLRQLDSLKIGSAKSPLDCVPLVQTVESRLAALPAVTVDEFLVLMRALNELREYSQDEVDRACRDLADNGFLMHYLQQATTSGDEEAKAWSIAEFLFNRPDASKPTGVGQSPAGHALLLQALASEDRDFSLRLLECLRVINGQTAIVDVPDARKTLDPLFKTIWQIIAETRDVDQVFTAAEIIKRWRLMKAALIDIRGEEVYKNFLRLAIEGRGLQDAVMSSGFSTSEATFYSDILDASDAAETFAKWCAASLGETATSEWSNALSGETDLLDLLLELVTKGIGVALGSKYLDAMIGYAAEVVGGKVNPSAMILERWNDLYESLMPALRLALGRGVLAQIGETDGSGQPITFQLYGKSLSAAAEAEPARAIQQIVIPMLKRKNAAGLEWVVDFLARSEQFLFNSSGSPELEEFRTRLRDAEETDYEPAVWRTVSQLRELTDAADRGSRPD